MRSIKAVKGLNNHIVAILLLLFFISEAFSKYAIYFEGGKLAIPRFIKIAVFVLLIIGLLKHFKSVIAPLILAAIFCFGQIFLIDGFKTEVMVSGAKLLFPIFLFIYFNKHPIQKRHRKFLFQTFEYLLIFNGILIFIGLIWKVHLFESYPYGRFGYNGLFITSGTSSYVYAIAIFYFLLKLKKDFLRNWKTIFVIVCAILTGTKILYIALVASLLIYLTHFVNFNRNHRRILFFGICAIFGLIAYFFFFHYGIFNQIRKEQGLLSSILSYRDDLLMDQTLPFIRENWTWPNYLFGGISDLAARSQMGFIDVFFFWGILGGLFYLYVFYKTLVTFRVGKSVLYILLILVLIVFLAGNFFENASVAIYLLILKETIISNDDKI